MHRFPAFLLDGYKSFMSDRYDPEQGRYRELADKGQFMLTCAPEVQEIYTKIWTEIQK